MEKSVREFRVSGKVDHRGFQKGISRLRLVRLATLTHDASLEMTAGMYLLRINIIDDPDLATLCWRSFTVIICTCLLT